MDENDPTKGDKNAPIVMLEFSDFQCPFCQKFWAETLPQIEKDYVDTGKVLFVYKDFPLSEIHPFAQQVAEKGLKALYIARKQNLPPKTHDLVELCRLTKASETITRTAGRLTIVYLPSHYPGVAPVIPVKFYGLEKAETHLAEAQEILTWAQKQIK